MWKDGVLCEVKVGLHQGSALSPLLFIIIMDVLAEEARTKPPWVMLLSDDLVLVSETAEEVEEEPERWRAIIENKGLRISRSKTEYLVPSHQEGVVKLEGEPLPSVNSFKYLGSVIDGSGGCGKDVDGRIKVAWSRWRDLSGVINDKKVPVKLKSKLYKTVVKPAMGLLECVLGTAQARGTTFTYHRNENAKVESRKD